MPANAIKDDGVAQKAMELLPVLARRKAYESAGFTLGRTRVLSLDDSWYARLLREEEGMQLISTLTQLDEALARKDVQELYIQAHAAIKREDLESRLLPASPQQLKTVFAEKPEWAAGTV